MNDLNLKIGDVVESGGIEYMLETFYDDKLYARHINNEKTTEHGFVLFKCGRTAKCQIKPVVKLIRRAKVKKTFEREYFVGSKAVELMVSDADFIEWRMAAEKLSGYPSKIKITFEAEIDE